MYIVYGSFFHIENVEYLNSTYENVELLQHLVFVRLEQLLLLLRIICSFLRCTVLRSGTVHSFKTEIRFKSVKIVLHCVNDEYETTFGMHDKFSKIVVVPKSKIKKNHLITNVNNSPSNSKPENLLLSTLGKFQKYRARK